VSSGGVTLLCTETQNEELGEGWHVKFTRWGEVQNKKNSLTNFTEGEPEKTTGLESWEKNSRKT